MWGRPVGARREWCVVIRTAARLAIGLLVASSALVPFAAAAEDEPEPQGIPDEWVEGAAILERDYGLTPTVAKERIADQSDRFMFREMVADALGPFFSGFRFDPVSGVQSILVTDADRAAGAVQKLAAEYAIPTSIVEVEYSYDELREIAAAASRGQAGIPAEHVESAQIDDNSNTVDVYVQKEYLPEAKAQVRSNNAIVVSAYEPLATIDEVCTSKDSCGGPLRGGIEIWRGSSSSFVCSLGFTATASDGSRWAITAGHCPTALDQPFGHSEQAIGLVRQYVNNPSGSHSDVDVARIRIDSTYWKAWAAAGYLLKINSSNVVQNAPNELSNTIALRSTIDIGDVLCLSAASPTFGDSCGTVSEEFDTRGAVVIGNYDACPGDSGGAWSWNAGDGTYWGFGVHEGGRNGCPVLSGGGDNDSQGFSVFSAIPDINDYWDATSAATIRIDE